MNPKLRIPARVRFAVEPVTGEPAGAAPVVEASAEQPPAATPDAQAAPDASAEPPAQDEEAAKEAAKVAELPDWAQAEINRLRAENAQRRTKAKELEEKLTGALSAEEAEKLRTAHAQLERSLIVQEVAFGAQLPKELADLLKGDTREEIEAHAKTLAALVAKPAPSPRKPGGGLDPTAGDDGEFDPVAAAQAARRRRY